MLINELRILSEALWEAVRTDLSFFSSISSFVKKLSEYNYSSLNKNDLLEIKIFVDNIEGFFKSYRPTGQGTYIPPHQTSSNDLTVKRIVEIVRQIDGMTEESLSN